MGTGTIVSGVQNTYRAWGNRLREARRARGLSQTAVAAQLGVDQTTISDWERGERSPTDDAKAGLVVVLYSTFEDLFPWPEDAAAS